MSMIYGKLVDSQSRCVHWNGELDIIALKFKCCERYYACHECHSELTDHEVVKYSRDSPDDLIICGVCNVEMTFEQYSVLNCPNCSSKFNPACKLHYDLYFD